MTWRRMRRRWWWGVGGIGVVGAGMLLLRGLALPVGPAASAALAAGLPGDRAGMVMVGMSALLGGLLGALLGGLLARHRERHRAAQATAAAVAQAMTEARQAVVHEVRMLEHAHLKSSIVEVERLLATAQGAATLDQCRAWVAEAARSAQRLHRVVEQLHRRGAAVIDAEDVHVTPVDLDRTLIEVCKNLRALGMRTRVERIGAPRSAVPEAVQSACELVLYNALLNAQRHGRATEVVAQITYGVDQVRLQITDNGCGFDPRRARQGSGRGLRDMETLAQRIGGTLEIASTPGMGTTITLTAPLPRPALGWAAPPVGAHADAADAGDARLTTAGAGAAAGGVPPPWARPHPLQKGRTAWRTGS